MKSTDVYLMEIFNLANVYQNLLSYKNEVTLLRNQSISRHVPIWVAPSQKGKVSPSFNSTGASVISK